MKPQEIKSELQYRIGRDVTFFNNKLPERYAIAWRAYLAGLLEWGVIDVATYKVLVKLLPEVNDDPATMLLKGRE